MTFELESYSVRKSIQQGRDIHQLVNEEADWLVDMFPGAVERYHSPIASIKNVARIARSEKLKAYVIRQEKVAHGVATVIFGQTIVHPTGGSFHGTDLDYWLAEGASEGDHEQVAFKLMLTSEGVHEQRRTNGSPGEQNGANDLSKRIVVPQKTIMGTIGKGDSNPSIGLASIMEPVGGPDILTTPDGNDPFGITKDGRILQLYIDRTTLQGSL